MLLNFFKQDTLLDIFRISPNTYTKLVNQLGIEDYENMVPTDLDKCFNLAIASIANELQAMGITISGGRDYHTDTELVITMLLLRELLGSEYLAAKLAECETLNRAITFDVNNYDNSEALLTTIIETMHSHLKISDGWIALNKERFNVSNNTSFIQHIQAILSKDVIISDSALSVISSYAKLIDAHVNGVKQRILDIINLGEVDIRFTDINFSRYDVDLVALHHENVRPFLDSILNHPAYSTRLDCDQVKSHKARSDHHFEYYVDYNIGLSEQQLTLLAAEHVIESIDLAQNITMVLGLIKTTSLNNGEAERIIELIRLFRGMQFEDGE